ncbi:MAG: hypothetical protein RMK93_05330 [Bacteroidota bacterium]|nr:hypothetical protein [Bacteroidota bacterium]
MDAGIQLKRKPLLSTTRRVGERKQAQSPHKVKKDVAAKKPPHPAPRRPPVAVAVANAKKGAPAAAKHKQKPRKTMKMALILNLHSSNSLTSYSM